MKTLEAKKIFVEILQQSHKFCLSDYVINSLADQLVSALEQSEKPAEGFSPEKEYFEKVYIKSVDDLPKETGSYYVHDKSYSNDFIITDYFDKEQHSIFNWLQNIDWYLDIK